MTVLASVSDQVYTPLERTISFTVDVNATRIQTTFTHLNTLATWPSGPLLTYEVLWNDIPQGLATIGGGVFNGKDGNPIAGKIATTFGTYKPPGFTTGKVRVTTLQALTTAILVEAF